jgi:hypothetical protein
MNPADGPALAQLLLIVALIAATSEYGEIVRRREGRRRADADRVASEAAGLRGLVRVFLSGSQTKAAGTKGAR